MRGLLAAALAALLLSAPVTAQRVGVGIGIGVGGSGGGSSLPTIANLTSTIAGDAAIGSAVLTPSSPLTGCTWTLSSQSNFAQATTGAITKAASSVSAGTYTPATVCSLTTGGQIISLTALLSITVTAPPGGILDFSDPANSGLI